MFGRWYHDCHAKSNAEETACETHEPLCATATLFLRGGSAVVAIEWRRFTFKVSRHGVHYKSGD